jgi:hypothetical protein
MGLLTAKKISSYYPTPDYMVFSFQDTEKPYKLAKGNIGAMIYELSISEYFPSDVVIYNMRCLVKMARENNIILEDAMVDKYVSTHIEAV